MGIRHSEAPVETEAMQSSSAAMAGVSGNVTAFVAFSGSAGVLCGARAT